MSTKVLGAGTYGKVFLGNNKADVSHKVAIKVLSKENMTSDEIRDLYNEVAIL